MTNYFFYDTLLSIKDRNRSRTNINILKQIQIFYLPNIKTANTDHFITFLQ